MDSGESRTPLITALSLIAYQRNRLRNIWWGRDEAILRRMQRQGRVVYGPGSFGIPKIHSFIHDKTRLIVGNYCSMGGNYMLGGYHPVDHVTTYPLRINMGLPGAGEDGNPAPAGDINVGSDCWTGYGCWVMAGTTVGDGAVIATGAVVTKDVPPYAIVGGVPAKVIKYRHTEEQRAELLRIRWWDWPREEIRDSAPFLSSPDIDAFIEHAQSKRHLWDTNGSGEVRLQPSVAAD